METFTIPGYMFQPDVALLRSKLVKTIKAKQDFNIAELFRFIRLTNENQSLQTKLINRGAFKNKQDLSYENKGRSIYHVIKDLVPGINQIKCSISRILKWDVLILNNDELELLIIGSSIKIEIPATREMGLSGQFILKKINLLRTGSEFILQEKKLSGDGTALKFLVDFSIKSFIPFRKKNTQDDSVVKLNPANLFSVKTVNTFDAWQNPCPCCRARQGTRRDNTPPSSDIFCARVLIKILVDPTREIIDMIESLQDIFSSNNIDIQLVHIEQIDDNTLLDIDIGQCTRNQTPTADQELLFSNRNFAREKDIVIYFVRSTIPATLGCAAHPAGMPGAIVTRNATLFTLAHEIGHVLSLNHVNLSNRLMFGNGTGNITDLPPDLIQSEIKKIQNSNLTIKC